MSSQPPSPTAPQVKNTQNAEIAPAAETNAPTVIQGGVDATASTAPEKVEQVEQVEQQVVPAQEQEEDGTCTPGHPDFIEYILRPNPKRFVLFPVQHDDMYQMYLDSMANFWVPGELDLEADVKDWKDKLTNDERHFIKHVLGFFAASDGIVNENLVQRFASEVQVGEARAFYGIQIGIETIHSHTYSLLLDTYIKDPAEKERMFNAIDTVPSIRKKANWAFKVRHPCHTRAPSLPHRLRRDQSRSSVARIVRLLQVAMLIRLRRAALLLLN